jgi:hypothetical protein
MAKAKPTILKIKSPGSAVQPVAPASPVQQDPYLEGIMAKGKATEPAVPKMAALPELATVHNPVTKSEFYVIGHSKEGLQVSVRFVASHEKNNYGCIFRVRLGDQLSGDYIENVYELVRRLHPGVHFTATPVMTPDRRTVHPHASVEGKFRILEVRPWDSETLERVLDEGPFIEELWYATMVRFATEKYELDREQFGRWIKQQMLRLCKGEAAKKTTPKADYYLPGLMNSAMKPSGIQKAIGAKEQKKADLANAGLA